MKAVSNTKEYGSKHLLKWKYLLLLFIFLLLLLLLNSIEQIGNLASFLPVEILDKFSSVERKRKDLFLYISHSEVIDVNEKPYVWGQRFGFSIWPEAIHSLVVKMVKTLPAMQKTWVRSLCWEGIMEKEMEAHSSILSWRITWTEKPGGLHTIMGSQRVRHNRATNTLYFECLWELSFIPSL